MERILEGISGPSDLKPLIFPQLNQLAEEVRELIIETISSTGGHLSSSLGAVDLAIALHAVFDSPNDKMIWDVGHQAYAHKILTGRREAFRTIRQYGGISGFPKRRESPHDAFDTGHSSTSISAALGLAKARDLTGGKEKIIAVMGDGALTAGMAYEGLNNAGHLGADLIVVLNDNEMSIARNVGAMAAYLSRLRMDPRFNKMRMDLSSLIRNIPKIGEKMFKAARNIETHLAYLILPGVIFETLGFTYLGPFDGHNIELLCQTFKKARDLKGPRIIHILTKKGKGYSFAEDDSTRFHGTIPFDVETGEGDDGTGKSIPSYTQVFGQTLEELAAGDPKIVAVTAAMPDGTGLSDFSRKFPDRFFDVGIAEQHAVTFAAGLAAGGLRPVVALYSTFLQRAYDQVIHDVAMQNLPVVFAVDRGGLVGEDGETHHGVFDLSFLRIVPNLVIMAPKNENEFRRMLKTALVNPGPSVVRYSRGKCVGVPLDEVLEVLPIGRGEIMREGADVAIIAIGNMVYPSLLAAENLSSAGIDAAVIDARFIKPLDGELIEEVARRCRRIVTVEENVLAGGFGSAVGELLCSRGLGGALLRSIGLPDRFIEHGSSSLLREKAGLTGESISRAVQEAFTLMG
ncbi:MAG: 1-deoxy-D-xylulose-5-phosphate synthase [bacterium]